MGFSFLYCRIFYKTEGITRVRGATLAALKGERGKIGRVLLSFKASIPIRVDALFSLMIPLFRSGCPERPESRQPSGMRSRALLMSWLGLSVVALCPSAPAQSASWPASSPSAVQPASQTASQPVSSAVQPAWTVAQAIDSRPGVTTVTAGERQKEGAAAKGQTGQAAVPAIPQLQRFARTTKAATGRFVQTQLGAGRRPGASSQGQFAFSRPGNFRWDIESPDQQLIVTDGKKLYFYDKDLQQVTIREASESIQATPAAVLFGVGDLNDSFRLREIGSRGGVAWVEAIPKKADSGFEQIRVGMRAGQPVVMEVVDAFGQINRFEFQQLKVQDSVPAEQFRFTPPAGVDVLE
ncbi:MAG: outer membrane lipoprotein chaperone LolA [Lautropia sp.]|nr:outer membrane lipoprotein chaperone LolA [Lautropia sp.]